MSAAAGTGMPLRDYRIHRYVNAFCPRCHEEDPERDLSEVRRLSGWLAVRNDRVWLERCRIRWARIGQLCLERPCLERPCLDRPCIGVVRLPRCGNLTS